MGARIRVFIESILFAGLEPSASVKPKPPREFPPLPHALDRFLTGRAPSDPLYLSNRPFAQKVRLAAAIAVPCILAAAALVMGLSQRLPWTGAAEFPIPPATAPIAQKSPLPPAQPLKADSHRDLEVLEIHIEQGNMRRVVCSIRNNTARNISAGEVVVDLTDASGSQLGAARVPVSIRAHTTATFQVPVPQNTATLGIIREVRINQ